MRGALGRLGPVRAVVTGGASGIGRSLCRVLSERGADVVCADIDLAAAQRVAAAIERDGGRALAVSCDVSSLGEVEALAAAAESYFSSPANVVINNAGIGAGGLPIGALSVDIWQRTLAVNLWGVIHGCHVFVPRLRASGRGSIINIASAASFASSPNMAAYNVSKAGVLSLSETLAAELGGTEIHVSVVCPTFVKTAIAENTGIEPRAQALARKAIRLTGRSADWTARTLLDAHEAGTFLILPQVEAKLIHCAKRRAPDLYQRMNALVARRVWRS